MSKIVIVEDDNFLRTELQSMFEKEGYCVACITSFETATEDIIDATPSLILLDLNLPYQSGFQICRELKAQGVGPILVLTSRNQVRDEVHAFNLGADDYVTKPCHPQRLLARVEKLHRLYMKLPLHLDAGDFQLDERANVLYVGEHFITLSENEATILKMLIKAAPSIVMKEDLFQQLWGTSDYVDENILQVNMTRLRKTLSRVGLSHRIQTVWGVGYQLIRSLDE